MASKTVLLGLIVALAGVAAGCASTPPPPPRKVTTWDLWITTSAGGVVVGTFNEAHCAAVSTEFEAGAPCRRVHVSNDPSSAATTLWLARFQVAERAGAEGPEIMMGHTTQALCLMVLERAMQRGMTLVSDCKHLGIPGPA